MEITHIDGHELAVQLYEQMQALKAELAHERSVNRALRATHAELQQALRDVTRSYCGQTQADGELLTLQHRVRHQATEQAS